MALSEAEEGRSFVDQAKVFKSRAPEPSSRCRLGVKSGKLQMKHMFPLYPRKPTSPGDLCIDKTLFEVGHRPSSRGTHRGAARREFINLLFEVTKAGTDLVLQPPWPSLDRLNSKDASDTFP